MKKIIYVSILALTVISCGDKKKKKTSNSDYKKQGLQYAMSTKAVLGKNLIGQLQKNGAVAALSFCNERAYPLTDSMSLNKNAHIKRVSDKYRNPKNKANTLELKHIQTFKNQLKNNKKTTPIVEEKDDKIHFYAPIITNQMCLKCHGSPEPNVLKKISELYPNDKAVGYDVNQVRGIWSIVFDKK